MGCCDHGLGILSSGACGADMALESGEQVHEEPAQFWGTVHRHPCCSRGSRDAIESACTYICIIKSLFRVAISYLLSFSSLHLYRSFSILFMFSFFSFWRKNVLSIHLLYKIYIFCNCKEKHWNEYGIGQIYTYTGWIYV